MKKLSILRRRLLFIAKKPGHDFNDKNQELNIENNLMKYFQTLMEVHVTRAVLTPPPRPSSHL